MVIRPIAICGDYLSARSVTKIVILRDQTEIIVEILAILAEQMLSSPFLLEVSQRSEEAFLTEVHSAPHPGQSMNTTSGTSITSTSGVTLISLSTSSLSCVEKAILRRLLNFLPGDSRPRLAQHRV